MTPRSAPNHRNGPTQVKKDVQGTVVCGVMGSADGDWRYGVEKCDCPSMVRALEGAW